MPILNRPLRVMHIISGDLWAGAEVQAFTLLKHLHAVTQLNAVLMNDGELAERLRAEGITVTVFPELQLTSFQIILKLINSIRKFKPDVLHTHRQKENIFGNIANLMANPLPGTRAKSIRTAHGAPEFAPKGKQKLQTWLDRFVGTHLQQGIIAVSAELAIKLEKIFPPKKIYVIHNGVDRNALTQDAKVANFRLQAPDSLHIGVIGRIEPVKRIDIFIEMANLLLNDHSISQTLIFHIIGDGGLRLAMEKIVAELELNGKIYFHGHRVDMASCISSLDAVVMCSDHEGTPMTALETLALGKKLIAHDVGGLREILKEYPSLLVSNHSPLGYKNCVINSIFNSDISIELPLIYLAEKNATDTLNLYSRI